MHLNVTKVHLIPAMLIMLDNMQHTTKVSKLFKSTSPFDIFVVFQAVIFANMTQVKLKNSLCNFKTKKEAVCSDNIANYVNTLNDNREVIH